MKKNSSSKFLIVDLDGTYLKTDLLWEALLITLKTKPSLFLKMFGWLLKGKAFFKHSIAQEIEINPGDLPLNLELQQLILKHKNQGDGFKVGLCSASPEKWVSQVAAQGKLFDFYAGSTQTINLSGPDKLNRIKEFTLNEAFDYAGDHQVDLPIWMASSLKIGVGLNQKLKKKLHALNKTGDEVILVTQPASLAQKFLLFFKAIRVHQYSKNVLLFVPLLLAHLWFPIHWLNTLLAFISFSLAASSLYILNDLLDLPSDRKHPKKKDRPFASGSIPIKRGVFFIPAMLMLSFALCYLLPKIFLLVLLIYIFLSGTYSIFLKTLVLIDVLTLASLYTLRLFAGSVVSSVPISPWLLAFSMFLFLSLAFVKRFTEIQQKLSKEPERNSSKLAGRAYIAEDLYNLKIQGISSGYLSVLVLALYMNSSEVTQFYRFPLFLWGICPLLLFWIARVWFLCGRNQMHHDPIVFAISDKTSYLVGLIVLVFVALASGLFI